MAKERLLQLALDSAFLPVDRPLPVRAMLLGERLNLAGLQEPPLAMAPLTLQVGNGLAMLFRYGAAVLFNLDQAAQDAFVAEIAGRVQEPLARPEIEETTLFVSRPEADTAVTVNGIGLYDFTLPRLKVIAIVLARSVALARYEAAMAGSFDMVEPLALHIEAVSGGRRMKDLLRQVGSTLLTQHRMVGRVEIQDKPEILWDRPELEYLYLRLESEYELRERNAVLERKLAIIARIAETTLNLLHNRRTLRVEWYIVILIVIEILLSAHGTWLH